MEFTALNHSSTSIELKWNSQLPAFVVDGEENRGINVDYHVAGDDKVFSILFCNDRSSYVFSNLSIFTNYCFSVAAFSHDEVITKRDNYKCVFTDEEGETFNYSLIKGLCHEFFAYL